jgi:DNA-binding MarR family transcriptional regulator/GNAT superfamily N-acetyltransferase
VSQEDQAVAIRAFNRFWTNHMGVLDAGLLDTRFSLTEARVLFELGHTAETDMLRLRHELRIDAGYLSRIVKRFERDGLVEASSSAADGRRRVLRLTDAGRVAFEDLDARSTNQATSMQSGLTDVGRRRLVAAMATIRELLEPPSGPSAIVIRPPIVGDFGWVVHRHGVIYAQEYGWDESFEALVARVVAEYVERRDAATENAWIAEVDGEPAGCVFCVKETDDTARLRLLLVEPSARGRGIGGRLVTECLGFARRAGYSKVTLWTNDVLLSARRIYEAAGFRLVKEEPHHSFGRDLVGQDWLLELDAPSPNARRGRFEYP